MLYQKCGQKKKEKREICLNCSNYIKCYIHLCEIMKNKAFKKEEKDYWSAEIAETVGG